MSTGPAWTDVAQAAAAFLSLIIATISAYFIVLGLRQTAKSINDQARSNDSTNVLIIFDKLDALWQRYTRADESSRDFEFGQLISYYEVACGLFRSGAFKTSTSSVLYQHLHDVLAAMRQDAGFSSRFDILRTTDDTFEHIEWLLTRKRHGQERAVL